MLEEMAQWIKVHGEAIYSSRPWKVYGEGLDRARGGSFNEDFGYTAKDIRFTTQGPTLYAISLAYPENNELLVRSLAKTDDIRQNEVTSVSLLGYKGKVEWSQDRSGLRVKLPAKRVSNITVGLKINGKNLEPVPLPKVVLKVTAAANGQLNLDPNLADLHGDTIQAEAKDGIRNLGFWFDAKASASWTVVIPAAGSYSVSTSVATLSDGAQFVVESGGQSLTGAVPNTGDWARFQPLNLGTLQFQAPGEVVITVRPKDPSTWKAINMRAIVLTPVKGDEKS